MKLSKRNARGKGFFNSQDASENGAVSLTNTTAYYGQTENDVNFANYTDINIEGGKGVNNKYFKIGKDMGFESFNGLFFTSNKTLISQNLPHINTTYELQIGFFKIQHTITNTIGSKESDWTFKIGSSTNLKIAGGVKVGTSYRLTEYINE